MLIKIRKTASAYKFVASKGNTAVSVTDILCFSSGFGQVQQNSTVKLIMRKKEKTKTKHNNKLRKLSVASVCIKSKREFVTIVSYYIKQ